MKTLHENKFLMYNYNDYIYKKAYEWHSTDKSTWNFIKEWNHVIVPFNPHLCELRRVGFC